jgi:hypothetical protein
MPIDMPPARFPGSGTGDVAKPEALVEATGEIVAVRQIFGRTRS